MGEKQICTVKICWDDILKEIELSDWDTALILKVLFPSLMSRWKGKGMGSERQK